jgi:hypothetical protein
MPRIPTTDLIQNPQRYGYNLRLGNLLLRTSTGPQEGRQLVIQSSDVETQQNKINVAQNAEDFTSNLGRIYSRNNFKGGQGLDTAHRANGQPSDISRFWDSKNIDVFHGDEDTAYHVHLLYTTESKYSFTNSNNYMVRTTDGTLYVSDGNTIIKSSNNGDTWAEVTDASYTALTINYNITGAAAFGNQAYFVTADSSGYNHEVIEYDGTTWTSKNTSSNTSTRLNGIWLEKGRFIIAGYNDDAAYLWEVNPFDTTWSSELSTSNYISRTEPTHTYSSATDAGAAILVSATDGNIYSLKEDEQSGLLVLKGRTRIGFEEVHTVAAAEGIVFFGTKEQASKVGRFYRAQLVVADDLYVLANRQLIKEWVTTVDSAPQSAYVSRDSIFVGVQEDDDNTYLWRYYLPTSGFARDLQIAHSGSSSNAKVLGLTRSGDTTSKFLISVEGEGIYKESSTYCSEGFIVTAAADFYTAEEKQFVGASVSTLELGENTEVELKYSNKFEDLDNPENGTYLQGIVQNSGSGDLEKQINPVARYIIGKLILKSDNGAETPRVKSIQFRALARPELVVAQIPINISDRIERPGRKPVVIKGLGDKLYEKLRQLEGDAITLQIFQPNEVIRGVVERVTYPIQSSEVIGSDFTFAIVTIRGTRQPTVTPVSSRNVFGGEMLGLMRFGA